MLEQENVVVTFIVAPHFLDKTRTVILRLFGPESMDGVGNFGARIDAETARTGLSEEEVGPKVHISIPYFYSD